MTLPSQTEPVQVRHQRAGAVLWLIGQVMLCLAAMVLVGLCLIMAQPKDPGMDLAAVLLIGLSGLAFLLHRLGTVPAMADGLALLTFAGVLTFAALASGNAASPFAAWVLILPLAAVLRQRLGLLLWAIALMALCLTAMLLASIMNTTMFAHDLMAALPAGAVLIVLVVAALTAAAISIALLAERVSALAGTQAMEAQYKALADGSPDVLLHFGGDGRIRFASAAARDLFDAAPGALEGRSLSEFVSGEDRRAVQRSLARANYFGADAALTFRLAGHDRRWIDMRCRPILRADAKRSLLAWASKANDAAAFDTIAVLRDVTDLMAELGAAEQSRDDAREANAAKSRFLANMSHELRTPLNAIIGFSDMMMSELFGPLGNPRYKEYVQHIKQGGEHLRDLINDVLDMSKIEAGRFDLEIEQVSVPKLLEDVLTTVSVTAGRKKIDLALEMATGLPHLPADRRAVKQMLLNLLANAIKFTPAGGQVSTSARRDGAQLILEVRDTGIGIPQDDLKRMAQPFEQAAKQGSDGEGGTGLGLALVKALAELHDGSLTIASAEGKGTRVTITLPLEGPQTGRKQGPAPVIRMEPGANSAPREVA